MDAFPEFVKHPANRIIRSNQATPGVEGYVFDGANGSQMAFWTCGETATSVEHVHDHDESMVVVQGCYTLAIHGNRITVIFSTESLAREWLYYIKQQDHPKNSFPRPNDPSFGEPK
jgi:hypothetical protein